MKPTIGGAALIAEYYHIAPRIVLGVNIRSNNQEIWNQVYDDLILHSVELIDAGKREEAVSHYTEYTSWMKEAFIAE